MKTVLPDTNIVLDALDPRHDRFRSQPDRGSHAVRPGRRNSGFELAVVH